MSQITQAEALKIAAADPFAGYLLLHAEINANHMDGARALIEAGVMDGPFFRKKRDTATWRSVVAASGDICWPPIDDSNRDVFFKWVDRYIQFWDVRCMARVSEDDTGASDKLLVHGIALDMIKDGRADLVEAVMQYQAHPSRSAQKLDADLFGDLIGHCLGAGTPEILRILVTSAVDGFEKAIPYHLMDKVAEKDDAAMLETLFDCGWGFDQAHDYGSPHENPLQSMLHFILNHRAVKCIELLRRRGITSDGLPSALGKTALANDFPEFLDFMLGGTNDFSTSIKNIVDDRDPEFTVKDYGMGSKLVQNQSIDCVRVLARHGVDPDTILACGSRLLTQAVQDGHCDFVKAVLDAGARLTIDLEKDSLSPAKKRFFKEAVRPGDGELDIFKYLKKITWKQIDPQITGLLHAARAREVLQGQSQARRIEDPKKEARLEKFQAQMRDAKPKQSRQERLEALRNQVKPPRGLGRER